MDCGISGVADGRQRAAAGGFRVTESADMLREAEEMRGVIFLAALILADSASAQTSATAACGYKNPSTGVYWATDQFGYVCTGTQPQQTVASPALGSPIAVSANSTTPVWTFAAGTRVLVLSWTGGAACTLSITSGGLTSTITVNAGYDFSPGGDPVPTGSVSANCPAATSINVWEGH
jgi:hypothetical protein